MIGSASYSNCLVAIRDLPGCPTLLCAPYAGGGGAAYASWLPLFLENRINLTGIRLPGRENRFAEPAHLNLDAMVHEILNALRVSPLSGKPISLFGHSMGAVLAFEMARQLEAQSACVVDLLIVSGANPPHIGLPKNQWSQLDDDQLLAEIGQLGAIPEELLHHAEYRQIALQILRPDLTAFETHRYIGSQQLKCPILVLGGSHDRGVQSSHLGRWAELTQGDTSVQLFQGGHFFIREQSVQVVAKIAQHIRRGS